MITTQDVTKLSKTFVTKKDLAKLAKTFATKIEFKTLKDVVSKNHSEIMTTLGEIVGELQIIREEQTVGGYRQAKHSDQLENHQSRITKLESLAS